MPCAIIVARIMSIEPFGGLTMAVLVIDENRLSQTGQKRHGGVARQYTGSAGKITNCQIGVFATYVFRVMVMRSSIARCIFRRNGPTIQIVWEAAYVPADVGFATKTKACDENDRTRDSPRLYHSSGLPVINRLRWLATSNSSYVGQAKATCLGSAALTCFDPGANDRRSPVPPADIARTRRSSDWKRPVGGSRNQGGRGYTIGVISNWADLEAEQFNSVNDGLWTRGLLIRRRIADDDLAFFTHLVPSGNSH